MAKNPWISGAQKIDRLMRKDEIELYESRPLQDALGEISDNPVLIGAYKANVTTTAEEIGEEVQGTVRTHNYEITLSPEVKLPMESKLFVKLVKVRQGEQGALVEVTNLVGGLLGWTLTAADEKC